MNSYRIKFHLGSGPNINKWQIKGPDITEYIEPGSKIVILHGCKLRNRLSLTKKIFNGSHRSVCGWIDALAVEYVDNLDRHAVVNQLTFNPKRQLHWMALNGSIQDDFTYNTIALIGKKVFTLKSIL